ncbi:hypothetical protein JN11_01817 [Mucilaginibacter frigoritolerans]|uniref:Uncharacterized protein n=1 Tax=Mucilaginibacter frigoritolerans TaxID=652788 RepID=A0A562U771_9SPHI|nr:hypothetical protein [Mucilaginibacter frigoritolerans]TWJ01666.1 hypothetical protein JN11_01817 [Mucilaginibacter frigoritolerans]
METTLNAQINWIEKTKAQLKADQPENKLTTFINSQEKNTTAWFLISMMVQGVFFLPMPAVLIYSFNAPAYILIFTLGLFFANIIAGMSNAGVKTIIYLFAAGVAVNLLMLAIFAL